MKEYEVQIAYTEFYKVLVMAEDGDTAIKNATIMLNNGELEVTSESFDADVVWEAEDE